MSKAYKCDLCGNLVEYDKEREDDYELSQWNINSDRYMPLDICPACYGALCYIIKERKEKVGKKNE